jgi:hypothetical protein
MIFMESPDETVEALASAKMGAEYGHRNAWMGK